MNYITPIDLKSMMDEGSECIVLDVREPYECEICSIGGIQIPMTEVAEKSADFQKDQQIVVICRTGKRAEAVANLLEADLGFSNIRILEGGILAYIDQVDQSLESY